MNSYRPSSVRRSVRNIPHFRTFKPMREVKRSWLLTTAGYHLRRRKPHPPAPVAQSESDSSYDEYQQFIAKVNGDKAIADESESKSDSDSDSGPVSNPDPPLKTKPSESEDSSEEEHEGEEQKVENPKSETNKKNPTHQSSSNINSFSGYLRKWSLEDDLILLQALTDYHAQNGRLPPRKIYKSFLSSISGSISFAVTEQQLYNKIKQLRVKYNHKKKKGPNPTFLQPHDVQVYKFCKLLFEDSSKPLKEKVATEPSSDTGMKTGKRKRTEKSKGSGSERVAEDAVNGGMADDDLPGDVVGKVGVRNDVGTSGVASGRDMAGSLFYLKALIKDMITTQQCPGRISKVEDVVAMVGESRARDFEAKTKTLRTDAIQLHAREKNLLAELFNIISNEMTND